MKQMVIANHLADGFVVFLGPDDRWCRWIGEGRVLEDPAEAEAALATAKRHEADNVVVDPTLIEVTIDEAGLPRPVEIREAIRAFGPTTGAGSGGNAFSDVVGR
ncbi:MAG TPA: DUF2849 domain-containing protein [Gammaproteobacteria bacterium]